MTDIQLNDHPPRNAGAGGYAIPLLHAGSGDFCVFAGALMQRIAPSEKYADQQQIHKA